MSRRYEKGHKEATHQHIVAVASATFRRDGYEGVGIATIMAEAGLTHGGFYAHFASKEALARAAIVQAFDQRRASLEQALDDAEPGHELEAVISSYLSEIHRDRPDAGCIGAALAPEVSRLSAETRQVFQGKMLETATVFSKALPADLTDERDAVGLAIFASLMGALQLARVIPDQIASAQLLETAKARALASALPRPR